MIVKSLNHFAWQTYRTKASPFVPKALKQLPPTSSPVTNSVFMSTYWSALPQEEKKTKKTNNPKPVHSDKKYSLNKSSSVGSYLQPVIQTVFGFRLIVCFQGECRNYFWVTNRKCVWHWRAQFTERHLCFQVFRGWGWSVASCWTCVTDALTSVCLAMILFEIELKKKKKKP